MLINSLRTSKWIGKSVPENIMTRLNQIQRTIISRYIELHNDTVRQDLRDRGFINNNGSINKYMHYEVCDWFIAAIESDNYQVEGGEVFLEIPSHQTYLGNPYQWEFEAKHFKGILCGCDEA